MSEKKIIAVVGATGAQGGGLVRAILNDPSSGFVPRAITRDVNSDNAKELARMGALVVRGDVDDGQSLRSAFEGTYGAYCGARNLDSARTLNPSMQTFEAWLGQNKNRIPLE